MGGGTTPLLGAGGSYSMVPYRGGGMVPYTGTQPLPEGASTGGGFKAKAGDFFKNHGQKIATAVGVISAIAIVATVATLTEKAINSIETVGEKMKALEGAEDTLRQKGDELADSLEGLSKKRKDLTKLVDSLKDLKRGTSDWVSAMH